MRDLEMGLSEDSWKILEDDSFGDRWKIFWRL